MEKALSPRMLPYASPPPSPHPLSNILLSHRKVNSGEISRRIEFLVAKQVREMFSLHSHSRSRKSKVYFTKFVSLALKMLEGRNLDEVFGKLERVWEKRVGPLNKGRFSMFRGLRIIFNKTLKGPLDARPNCDTINTFYNAKRLCQMCFGGGGNTEGGHIYEKVLSW